MAYTSEMVSQFESAINEIPEKVLYQAFRVNTAAEFNALFEACADANWHLFNIVPVNNHAIVVVTRAGFFEEEPDMRSIHDLH